MKKKSNAGKIGLAGVAAAAAAGAYYLYGSKNAKDNREKASKMAKNAEAYIVKGAKKGIKVAQTKLASTEMGKEIKKVTKAVKKAVN